MLFGGKGMKSIGIVICNYNKKEYILSCIESVLESNTGDFDIYVVDNASSDGSVDAIREKYADKINILVNSENKGGSGGFNTGLRVVLEKNYSYIMCLDNDVLVDEGAIKALYTFLENHKEVGMAGSMVYNMEENDYVQQFGLNIDFDKFCLETLYENHIDDGTIPEILYCDAVATCSMMARTSVLRKIGIMPEANFIYWDDIEWGYLCNKSGYKVAACGMSKVLHAMGANKVSISTFPSYYMWRNWISFFMKYTPEEKLEKMSFEILKETFYALYECSYRGEHKLRETIMYAYHDALNQVNGKADEGKIFNADPFMDKLKILLENKKSVTILCNDEEYSDKLIGEIKGYNSEIQIYYDKVINTDITIKICPSIFHVKELGDKYIYIDIRGNIMATKEDRLFAKNYEFCLEYFIYSEQPRFLFNCRHLNKFNS
jgi:GT2 family glycosyltransferase